MTCKLIQTEGITAIVCGPRGKSKPCHYCHRASSFLCDHPVIRKSERTTCDTPMCESCRNNVQKDVDLCRAHFNLFRNNGNKFVLGGVTIA